MNIQTVVSIDCPNSQCLDDDFEVDVTITDVLPEFTVDHPVECRTCKTTYSRGFLEELPSIETRVNHTLQEIYLDGKDNL